ncbi:MAG TPA: hypothetical protein PLE74_04240 [Candidatus Cloacimonadota bacterium]|nr:hypothetical protein [Candidatus Cloacimonadota bacterium]HPT71469.1 hypothetical protein [Candidatus Cloacimonadota bacterium]
MSKKLILILLLVSFAFNLAFIGSFLYWRYQFRHGFAERHQNRDRWEQRMGPRDGQQPPPPPGLRPRDVGWMENRKVLEPFRNKFTSSKVDFFKTLQQPVVNEELLKQKLDTSVKNHNELETQIGLRLIEMRKKMTPQQANDFFGKQAENRMRHDKRPYEERRNK